ncbi:MAG: U32 family peptidase [Proteobacteria bacterium]|nr:U32 family peptidase [Pseudomonadota bacterium]
MSQPHYFIPELLSPAGNLDKLKTAILYGANAVYCAGQDYGLRAAADNFTREQLSEGVAFAHAHGARVYVVLNGFLHDEDLKDLGDFVSYLKSIQVDAVIVSDPGVALLVAKHGPLELHVSTQASVLNLQGVLAWKELGAKRVVLGREVTIQDAGALGRRSEVEMELFVHGAMCMAYSGHCVISNYTQGRDSNRGGCAHSCRFSYDIQFEDQSKKVSHFMSSKDLEGLEALVYFIKEGIQSLKIEGRMKSLLYAASTTRIYRQALDYWKEHGSFEAAPWSEWESELRKLPHRDSTTASLLAPAAADSVYDQEEHLDSPWLMAAVVLESSPEGGLLIDCRHGFMAHAHLELLPFRGQAIRLDTTRILAADFESIEKTKPASLVRLPHEPRALKGQVIRLFRGEA